MIASGDESYAEVIFSEFEKLGLTQKKFSLMQSIGSFVGKSKNFQMVKKGIDAIVKFRDAIPEAFKVQTDPFINGMLLKGLATQKRKPDLLSRQIIFYLSCPKLIKKVSDKFNQLIKKTAFSTGCFFMPY
jgi:aminopeptidase N